jgi:hypothetical protein
MSKRYQVLVEGSGFCFPVEDDDPIFGFYTTRRVLAASPEAAEAEVIRILWTENKIKNLVEGTLRHTGSREDCCLKIDEIQEVSWFSWHFKGYAKGLVLFSKDVASPD